MDNIVDFEANMPHAVSECVCLKCLYRWIAIRPEQVLLKNMECPKCGDFGYVIETGERIGGGDDLK